MSDTFEMMWFGFCWPNGAPLVPHKGLEIEVIVSFWPLPETLGSFQSLSFLSIWFDPRWGHASSDALLSFNPSLGHALKLRLLIACYFEVNISISIKAVWREFAVVCTVISNEFMSFIGPCSSIKCSSTGTGAIIGLPQCQWSNI